MPGKTRRGDGQKPSACRCLFGPVDHTETEKYLEEVNRDLDNAAAARWNFDFSAGQPLQENGGRYKWEKTDAAQYECIPSACMNPLGEVPGTDGNETDSSQPQVHVPAGEDSVNVVAADSAGIGDV